MVPRREPYGYFAIITAFLVIEAVSAVIVEGGPLGQWPGSDMIWPILFAAGAVAFAILRMLAKRTAPFSTEPRDNVP